MELGENSEKWACENTGDKSLTFNFPENFLGLLPKGGFVEGKKSGCGFHEGDNSCLLKTLQTASLEECQDSSPGGKA